MSWRPHSHAHVRPSAPSAWASCDRCNDLYLHSELTWQYQWAGPRLQNLRLLVCRKCLDVPQPQLKPRILPPDPIPIMNARPFNYTAADSNWLVTTGGDILGTQDDLDLTTQNSSNSPDDIP